MCVCVCGGAGVWRGSDYHLMSHLEYHAANIMQLPCVCERRRTHPQQRCAHNNRARCTDGVADVCHTFWLYVHDLLSPTTVDICRSVCLSVCLLVCLSTFLSVPAYLFVCCVCFYLYMKVCESVTLSAFSDSQPLMVSRRSVAPIAEKSSLLSPIFRVVCVY